jgi:hypothetical protein
VRPSAPPRHPAPASISVGRRQARGFPPGQSPSPLMGAVPRPTLGSAFHHEITLWVQDLQDSPENFTPDVVDPCNADAAVACSYVPCSMQLHLNFIPLSETGTEPGTPMEGPPSVGIEEDAVWKAVLVSPLDVNSGYTDGCDRCSCCGGGGGTLGGCRRSAIMSLSPPIPVVAEPCAKPMCQAAPSYSWPFFGRSGLPMHSIAV